MNNFRGTSSINLDSKGRMAMPTKYRETLGQCCGGRLFITLSTDRCLSIYPQPKWMEIEAQFEKTKSNDAAFVAVKRLYVGHAIDCQMDAQGRISVPQLHRDFAELGKKVVLVGQLDKFELWNEQVWLDNTREVIEATKGGRMVLPSDIDVAL